jgi:multicomponent Na+:H+ antiporter subunit E
LSDQKPFGLSETVQKKTRYIISLGSLLSVLWLALSGHYTLLLLACGLLSVILIVWLVLRMHIVDRESQPLHLRIRHLLSFFCWLIKEIFISNIYVCRLVLSPSLNLNPKVITINGNQSSDMARFIFANSITLTPSTLTIYVGADQIEVHALTESAAQALLQSPMGKKITEIERGSGG